MRISGLRNRRKSFRFDVLGVSIFIAINPVDAEHHCGDSVPATGPSCVGLTVRSERSEIGSVYFS